jgi:exosortase B
MRSGGLMAQPQPGAKGVTPDQIQQRHGGLPGSSRETVLFAIGVLIALLVAYGPTIYNLATTVWLSDTQGQGPVVLGLGLWLLWRRIREAKLPVLAAPSVTPAAVMPLIIAAVLLVVGGVLAIPTLEVLSILPTIAGILVLTFGPAVLRRTWFALLLMIFMVPLPESWVGTVTLPIKIAVSVVAEHLLTLLEYPIARSGVVLYVGQYQLMIADACAGLNTLFTLESIGLMYIELFRFDSMKRNVLLSILVIPISFLANVLRVVALCLITYHFGDAVGQGFLHEGAGIFLFMCAIGALMLTDKVLQFVFRKK